MLYFNLLNMNMYYTFVSDLFLHIFTFELKGNKTAWGLLGKNCTCLFSLVK